jgi:hypothetical protein
LANYLFDHGVINLPKKKNDGTINSRLCWNPGTPRGIRELIAASNSLYLKREQMFLWSHNNDTVQYSGWTECSASPNAEKNNMIDAIVIELPLSEQRGGKHNSNMEDLENDMLLDLKETLQGFAHLNFPVLLLKQTRGMKERECALVWEGKVCDEGYSKEFVSVEIIFNDGSCLAKAKGEDEVRFHDSNSGYCPQVPIIEGEGEHPMTE